MPEQKIYFDGKDTLTGIFADNLVSNIKIFEEVYKVKIVARDGWIKISSEHHNLMNTASYVIKELINVFEQGYSILQKDYEFILNHKYNQSQALNIKDFYSETIKVSPRKNSIIPRTISQFNYIRSMKKNDIVFGVGPAGTGKTYLAMAMAISLYLKGDYNRIILTRPAMEAGENLGFLPGTLEEKIKPYLRPLYDALYEMMDIDEANKLLENNIVEVAPLAFMRGRTLNNAFIILDEAQNTTNEQMMMFLTRLGFDSKCIVTGDPSQSDLPENKPSGLVLASKILKSIKEISFQVFTSKDVVRNALVEKIINAYDKNKTVQTIK